MTDGKNKPKAVGEGPGTENLNDCHHSKKAQPFRCQSTGRERTPAQMLVTGINELRAEHRNLLTV